MEKNDWQLAFVRADGTVCPLVGGEITPGRIVGLIDAVFSLKRFMPPIELVINEHLVSGYELTGNRIEIKGIKVFYEQSS